MQSLNATTGGRWQRAALFAAAVIGVGIADGVVLAQVKAFFGSGYNGQALAGIGDGLQFFVLGAACDGALIAVLALGFATLLRPLVAGPRREVIALGLATALPIVTDIALHQLHRTLGDVIALDLVMELAAGDERGAFEEVLASIPSLSVVAMLVVGGGALLWFGSGWLAGRLPETTRGPLSRVAVAALALLIGIGALQLGQRDPVLRFGLGWKPSGMVLGGIVNWLTDLDFDGAGLMALPRDAAPFDGSRHPFALDLPGNGIDENGLAGDLPLTFVPSPPLAVPAVAQTSDPKRVIALVLLESFRADLIGLEHAGRAVTPHLARLAAEGASSERAFTHSAMTWPARASIFQGRVIPEPDAETLVDDFRAAGFEVAWISGQHDGLREGPRYLGYERADHFFDARDALERRTSRSAQPISLQVSWKTVISEVERYLADRSDRATGAPLFLYVNLVDTHFPYDHGELDRILVADRLPRDAIFRENREAVWAAYLNAAAGVDRGVGELRALLEEHFGRGGVSMLVTADHGEAFYEPRFLGHGQALDRVQMGVPWIGYQLGGSWPEPLGLSDVRGALTAATHHPPVAGSFVPDPDRALFQYAGNVDRPRLLGLRTLAGVTSWTPTQEAPRPDDDFVRMIHAWEAALNGASTD